MARRLIAMPGIVRPVATGARLLRSDAANLGIEQRQRVVKTIHAVFADDAEQPHTAAHFYGPGSGATHLLNHLRLIALREQALFSVLAAVARADRNQRFGDRVEGVRPGNLHELVLAAGVEQVSRFVLRRQLGKASVGPGLPALAHDRMAQPVGSVDDPVEGIALGTLAWVPVRRCLIAVEIGVSLIVVSAAKAGNDAVAHVGAHAASVGIVGRADPIESAIVFVLIAINFFPVPIDRSGQGIIAGAGI